LIKFYVICIDAAKDISKGKDCVLLLGNYCLLFDGIAQNSEELGMQ